MNSPEGNDPMTIETARMFYERAVKAEAIVKRLHARLAEMPYPSDWEHLQDEVERLSSTLAESERMRTANAKRVQALQAQLDEMQRVGNMTLPEATRSVTDGPSSP